MPAFASDKSERTIRPVVITGALLIYAGIVLMRLVQAGGLERICSMGVVCFDRTLVAPQLVPQLALALPLAILGITPLIHRKLVHAWFSWPVTAALILLAGQIAIAGSVNAGWIRHSTWLPPLHLLLSLIILGLLLVPTTLSFYPDERLSLQTFPAVWRAAARTLSGRLSWLTLGAVFVSLVSGALVSGDASLAACPAWPFCASSFWPADAGGWLNLFHRASVGVSGLLLAAFLWDAWRARRAATAPLVAAFRGRSFVRRAIPGRGSLAPGRARRWICRGYTRLPRWAPGPLWWSPWLPTAWPTWNSSAAR